MTLLLDTSVRVGYLRDTGSPAAAEVAHLLASDLGAVATAMPIVMELLAGARDEAALASLEPLPSGLQDLSLDAAVDVHAAAAVYRAGRRSGRTFRGLVDCLVAAVLARHGARRAPRHGRGDGLRRTGCGPARPAPGTTRVMR
jgi:predicted nucleic acid-binding protein